MTRSLRTCVLGVLALALASPAAAQRSLAIQDFHAEIRVNADGTLDVVETIRPRFTGTWNGIYRTIPVEYRTPQGFNYTLLLDSVTITDEQGQALRSESSRQRHYRKFKIWVPGARDAAKTVVLRYRVRNGLKFFDEHDELYWNVTGDEWDVPIEAAAARVSLPPGAAGLRATAFTGGYGSRDAEASVNLDPGQVTVRSLRPLSFKEGLTVVVGWYPGVVARPTGAQKTAWFIRANFLLFVPPVVLVAMWRHWYRRGRDPRRRPIAPAYEPPAQLSPGELGTLIDNSAEMRDVTATLVDLAVRGYVLIEEKDESHLFGLISGRNYVFSLRKPRSQWAVLKRHEQWLLASLFKGSGTNGPPGAEAGGGEPGESVTLSQLENRFYKDLPELRNRLFAQLVEQGYYTRRPDRVKTAYIVGGVVSGLVIGVGGALMSVALGVQPFAAIIAGALTALTLIGFGLIMPARTEQGTRVLEGVLGFEEFLSRVEADRFDRVIKTPEMFEAFLPFAMAVGVEKTWARAFEGICKEPPQWYRGGAPGAFYPYAFVGSLNQMSTRAASAMASAPRSSGGSGFGGGGSSGGGFGGGGGGGF
ncbi:MAG: DUF2207 domain-containing protein [Planctomycetes bacterium]|nr:DUF2207 domain-containing protein [Planctomycetota bacterium]